MEDTTQVAGSGARRLWQRRSFWMAGATLALVGAAAVTAPLAWAARPFGAFHGGGHGFGRMGEDPVAAKQHVGFAIEFALRGVDASEEQRQQARRIAERAIDDLAPLAETHRANREAIARELAKPTIDRAAVERLRTQELALADQASRRLVTAVLDVAEVLTPEQRTELIELAHRFHGAAAGD